MHDYIPNNDLEYTEWAKKFREGLDLHHGALGVAPAEYADLLAAVDLFTQKVSEQRAAETLARAATAAKREARDGLSELVRPIARRINNHPAMTDAIRAGMGLRIKQVTANELPTAVPNIRLEAGPGAVFIHFGASPGNERINKMPPGVKGCNIYRVGPGETEWRLIAFSTTSPYIDHIASGAAEYTYMVKYRGTKANEIGHQSLEASIAAGGALRRAA